MNTVQLIGRLTKDPELRFTQNGKEVLSFSLAVDRTYKGNDGKTEVDFIRCQAWGKTAENIAKFLSKGSRVAVVGSIQVRKYTDKQNIKREFTEVVCNSVQFLDSAKSQNKQEKQVNSNWEGQDESGFQPFENKNNNDTDDFWNF